MMTPSDCPQFSAPIPRIAGRFPVNPIPRNLLVAGLLARVRRPSLPAPLDRDLFTKNPLPGLAGLLGPRLISAAKDQVPAGPIP